MSRDGWWMTKGTKPGRWTWTHSVDGAAVHVAIEHPDPELVALAIGRAIQTIETSSKAPDSLTVEPDVDAGEGSHGSAPSPAPSPLFDSLGVTATPRPRLPDDIDDGPKLHHDNPDIEALKAEINALDGVERGWLGHLETAGRRKGLPWRGLDTLRAFSIGRGLVDCLAAGFGDPEIRELCAAAGLGDLALMPAFELGHVVAALHYDQAVRFSAMATAARGDHA